MRFLVAAIAFASVAAPGAAIAQTPAAAAASGHYTTADTDLGTLLDDPAAKAVLVREIPDVVGSDQVDMARSMTLKSLQSYASDKITDKKLADIDAQLARLPAKK